MTESIIKLSNLTKFYGKFRGIENLNLEVFKGEIFGFLGPNAAGKTTTLRLLLNLLRPTSGKIKIFGKDISRHKKSVFRRIGNVPGEFNLYNGLTGNQFLKYINNFSQNRPLLKDELIHAFNLTGKDLNRKIKYYSNGMKQKLVIIQAIQEDPDILIMDEPSEGLDPLNQNTLYEYLRKFKERGKTKLKQFSKKNKYLKVDIYILFEHKSYKDKMIFMQLLKYMYLMWQKDSNNNKNLRIILPIVFYHGKSKWDIPMEFNNQFKVNDELKNFLLNFRYILFDTNKWDNFESNPELKENIFLLTSLMLMKSAYDKNFETIKKIFDFWKEKGFIYNSKDEKLIFFITYIMNIKDINQEKITNLLDERNIPGGEIMPSLAQRLTEQGFNKGIEKGIEKGIKEGITEGKLKDAKKMFEKGFGIEDILEITELSKKDLIKAGVIKD